MWQLPKLAPEEILIYLRKSRADDPLLTVEEVLAKHDQMIDDWISSRLTDCGPVPGENVFRITSLTLEST